MNFYPHHIGDFNNSTRHLTRVERSVYRDAIELYYDTESALTSDIEKLYRKLLCVSEEEKNALNVVLEEFFLKTEAGYIHERCDIEISKYRSNTNAKARAGIASAAKRKQNSTPVEHVLNECSTNHKPLTINQEPNNTLSGKPDPAEPKPKKQNFTAEATEVLDHLNRVVGTKFQPVAANLNMIAARLREGFSVDAVKAVVNRQHREWGAGDMRKYLRPETLFNATKFAGYAGQVDSAAIPSAPAMTNEEYAAKKEAEMVIARKAYLRDRDAAIAAAMSAQ